MIILPYIPSHVAKAEKNILTYVRHIRENTIFFRGTSGLDWEELEWDLTKFYPTTGNVKSKAIFTDKKFSEGVPFPQPFMDEAKAIVADFLRQSKTRSASRVIVLLRQMYRLLPQSKEGKTLNSLSDVELYLIEDYLNERYADPYVYCRLLERLVHDIIEPAKITQSRLSWRSGQKYITPNRTDLVGERNRLINSGNSKLPDLRCIIDLAGVFNNSQLPSDVIVTSWFAISMYAPSRINEILTLPLDCQRYDDVADGAGHGLAWLPEKGGDPIVKRAVSEESAQIVKTAIKRLAHLGASARRAAHWYESSPNSLFLPKQYEHLRGQPLTLYEMGRIIGRSGGIPPNHALKFGIRSTDQICKDASRSNTNRWVRLYRFEDLEKYVLAKLPYGWPVADQRSKLKYSAALFTMPFDIMRNYSETCENIPQFITTNIIKTQLGSGSLRKHVFERNNLFDPKTGELWKLGSHQPRHLLNTIAQSKHLSQELIAFWSGRKSVKQNDYYDHTSQEFIIEAYLKLQENAPKELVVTGPLNDKLDARTTNEPIDRGEALKEEIAAFHVTQYGYCRHNFSLTPCPKDKWCNNCGEAYFAKGDVRQIKMAELEVFRFSKSLAKAKTAKLDGEFGVERWLEKLETDLLRARLKLEKLTDPSVEDGTIISLPPPSVSQTKAGLSMEIRRVENFEADRTIGPLNRTTN